MAGMTPNRRRHPCHDLTYLLPYTKISPFPSKPRPVGLDSFFYVPQCMYVCILMYYYNNLQHLHSTFYVLLNH